MDLDSQALPLQKKSLPLRRRRNSESRPSITYICPKIRTILIVDYFLKDWASLKGKLNSLSLKIECNLVSLSPVMREYKFIKFRVCEFSSFKFCEFHKYTTMTLSFDWNLFTYLSSFHQCNKKNKISNMGLVKHIQSYWSHDLQKTSQCRNGLTA